MSKLDDFPKPKFIEGGCLCGSVRYRVDFAPDHDFFKSSGSCQCTQDRKQTGSFCFPSLRIVPPSRVTFTDTSTLKTYSASPVAERSFCGNCGGFLFWQRKGGEAISIAVGSVDALYLFGEGSDTEEGKAKGVPRGGFAMALANGGGSHEWCACEIPGVTDNMPYFGRQGRGRRWQGDEGE